jgi:nitrite reductase (NADH) small subunit
LTGWKPSDLYDHFDVDVEEEGHGGDERGLPLPRAGARVTLAAAIGTRRRADTEDEEPGDAREAGVWVAACALDEILPDTGVCALIDGQQVALVRVGRGEQIYALGNFDPFSEAFVLSRGIVGDRGGVPKIASPIYKQSFDLRTGQCLDDPNVAVPVWAVRVREGRVEVRARPTETT